VVTEEPLPRLGDRYAVLSQIGVGGMGRVYLAEDKQHGRRVAIKVLSPELAGLVGPQRFLREIRIAASLSHPNIVPVYDSGESDGRLFYVMPYIEGENLRDRLRREIMLPVPQAIAWAVEICEALEFLHAQGIVHRDLKPENLLLQADHLLLADFGIAKPIHHAEGNGLTSQHMVVGTATYMSPEQAGGSTKVDGRSDIYSLACVVYEMLTGEPPFSGPTPQAITAKKLSGRYLRVRLVRPTVPETIERTLRRALSPFPADRFRTVEEFSRALQAPRSAVWRRALLMAGAAIAGGTAALLGYRLLRETPASEAPSRVVVGIFANRTGDSQFDPLGFMAADWITEGLQRTGEVEVVPTLTAMAATRYLRRAADTLDLTAALARETGARLVVNGSVYLDGDSLVLQAQLVDAAAGKLLGAVEPIRTSATLPGTALQPIRARLMGLLALTMDTRAIYSERPPLYAAYQAFSQGMDAYLQNDYRPALAAFERAHAADSTFALPLLYGAFCHINLFEYARGDSLLRLLRRRRDQLNAYHQHWLDYQIAELHGNDRQALAAIRAAAEMAPASKATYNFAVRAHEARQPIVAESALRALSPDVGAMRGWLGYWEVLTASLHAQAKYEEELTAARAAQRRFFDRPSAYQYQMRALAALGRLRDMEKLWTATMSSLGATPVETGRLALEAASELAVHADSAAAHHWYRRAYDAFATGDTGETATEARWGRVRAAAQLGRHQEALRLGSSLAENSKDADYLGFVGVEAARLGLRARAESLGRKLEADTTSFTYGRPQFQAARIAAALGDVARSSRLLLAALRKGHPYHEEIHRDPALKALQSSPIMHQLLKGDD
jgi:TolB-like protein/predicted Ser/Thr protein kinase